MRSGHLLAAVAAAVALGCSGDGGANQPTPGGNTETVSVVNNRFDPSALSVPPNSTVTWQWNSGGVTHNVTFQDGPASGDQSSGSFARTFQTPGTYPYLCTIHGAQGMTGTVTVTAGTSTGGSGGGGGGGGGGDYP
jgi:plastocyanin